MKSILPIVGILAATIAAAPAASIVVNTVGAINGNGKIISEAPGSTVTSTIFASDISTAYGNNTGGVWNFDESAFTVSTGETITLNYGTSFSNSLVLSLTEGVGASGINQGNIAGEATSGAFEMGLSGNAATRTFTPDKGLLEIGIFNTDRNDVSRLPVLTVYFQDTTTASTTGANADNVFFHGFITTESNPIVKFELSQNNFVRYDDLGFVVVPEPSSAVLLGLVGFCGLIRRRR